MPGDGNWVVTGVGASLQIFLLHRHGLERVNMVTLPCDDAVRAIPRPLVVFTWSGYSAILASKTRPAGPIFALTPHDTVCDRLRMVWGVTALKVPYIDSTDDLIAAGERALMESGMIEKDTEVIILAGHTPLRGATNLMKIERVDGRSS